MPWTIAPIQLADAEEAGAVHTRVWQEAYAGLMPADYLAALDPARAGERRRQRILHPAAGVEEWVARDEHGIVGMAATGPPRDLDPPVPLELYAINVLRRAHGSGLADDLMAHAIGDRAAYLWVLEGNQRAIAFYRRHGFADEGGRKPEPDTGVVEMRMARGNDTGDGTGDR
ncbi:MAG TPA: GNAT family N-acetyltransferase [Nocardioides sp.]|uniref:GNAT family N-acetyltransferase n=1 Tax=Actinomycetes TaxID=1760 RepID=UPI002B572F08|nr:GNAT family N-acetyltransferase [Flexivirga sp.]HWC23065.1 GNAT family N-acetyltransferase [Flexivirga sp.]